VIVAVPSHLQFENNVIGDGVGGSRDNVRVKTTNGDKSYQTDTSVDTIFISTAGA